VLYYERAERISDLHWTQASDVINRLRDNLITIKTKHALDIHVPTVINSPVTLVVTDNDGNKPISPRAKSPNTGYLSIVAEEDSKGEFTQSNSPSTSVANNKQSNKMAQTQVQFLKTASSLIPDFDGKAENLRSFLDALQLVNSIKETHESTAVQLIKTKLKGNARNLISNENSIAQIISTLSNTVRGESVEVITAKLLNLQQKSKTANQYTQEVEKLTKALEGAYITDGLPSQLASKYSTQHAVKSMIKNCSIDKVKLIMEAGQFSNMNEAVAKFVNSCTDATGRSDTVLYYKNRQANNYRGSNYGYNRGNGNGRFRGTQRARGSNSYRGGNSYRGRQNYRNNGNNNNQNGQGTNVRVTQTNSENQQNP